MMQDVFIEYMVAKRQTIKTTLLKLLIAGGGVTVAIVAFMASPLLGALNFLGLVIAVGVIYGAWVLITGMNIEYEYSLTNGELDIDKITAQRKRGRLLSVKVRDVEDFGRYNAQEQEGKTYQTKIFACDHPLGEGLWYFVTQHRDKGKTLVVFNASDKMLEGMRPFLPRTLTQKAFRGDE
jgi:hypothetical protein